MDEASNLNLQQMFCTSEVVMKFKLFAIAIAILLCTQSLSTASITNTYLWDMSDGVSTGSAATGSNMYAIANPYVAEANTEGSQGNSTASDSGINASGRAFIATHITDGGGTPNIPADGSYQTFGVQALGPSVDLSLDFLEFDIDSVGFNTPFITGTLEVDVYASLDGFATSTLLGNAAIIKNSAASVPGFTASFNLSTFSNFQNVSNADVDFRMLFSDTFNDNGIETTIDNVRLTITTVPEPTGLGLLALVALGGLGFRRRS